MKSFDVEFVAYDEEDEGSIMQNLSQNLSLKLSQKMYIHSKIHNPSIKSSQKMKIRSCIQNMSPKIVEDEYSQFNPKVVTKIVVEDE